MDDRDLRCLRTCPVSSAAKTPAVHYQRCGDAIRDSFPAAGIGRQTHDRPAVRLDRRWAASLHPIRNLDRRPATPLSPIQTDPPRCRRSRRTDPANRLRRRLAPDRPACSSSVRPDCQNCPHRPASLDRPMTTGLGNCLRPIPSPAGFRPRTVTDHSFDFLTAGRPIGRSACYLAAFLVNLPD